MKTLRTALIIIDGQNCFMSLPGSPLPVTGSVADMTRLIRFIQLRGMHIERIICSLDTHVPDHVSHAVRWINQNGDHPAPFTIITSADYEAGLWQATNQFDQVWQGEYLKRLTRPHVIWPVHGQKPAWEWQLYHDLDRELDGRGNVWYVEKGLHREVEQFGIFGADVPYPHAYETQMNHVLIGEIDVYDRVIFAGEAASHCVMDSVKQFLAHAPSQDPTKVVLLKDCMSPVTGFEEMTQQWFLDMSAQGVSIIDSADFTP